MAMSRLRLDSSEAKNVVRANSIWQDPQALSFKAEATYQISEGAVAEGNTFGISSRAGRRLPKSRLLPSGLEADSSDLPHFEDSYRQTDLNLLHFEDSYSPPATNQSWGATQPRSYVEWAYRNTPWHEAGRQPRGSQTSRAAASTSACGGRSTSEYSCASGSWKSPKRATTPQCKSARAVSSTPTSMAGSTRVPSRATQASPETARGPSRATQPSPEELAWPTVHLPPSRPPPCGGGDPQPHRAAPQPHRSRTAGRDRSDSPNRCSAHSPDSRTSGSPDAPRPFGFGSAEISQTPSPEAHATSAMSSEPAYCAADAASHAEVPAFHLSCTELLGMKAEAAGAKARGAVTAAIRARAVCRQAVSAASRRLLHLHDDKPYSFPHPTSIEVHGEGDSVEGLPEDEDIAPNTWDDFTGFAPRRKRSIKVTRNSALGRMVQNDPEKAGKYNLVTVPAWTQNKPWPPPAVKFIHRPSNEDQIIAAEDKSPQKLSFRKQLQKTRLSKNPSDASRKSPLQVKAMTHFLNLKTQSTMREQPSISISKTEGPGSSFGSDSNLPGNPDDIISQERIQGLELATNLLDYSEKEKYRRIFQRWAVTVPSGSKMLSRAGMVQALQASGYTPRTIEEKRSFAVVQEQILQFTRKSDTDIDTKYNPVLDPGGLWTLHEFYLMVEAMHEIDKRKWRQYYKEFADELNVSIRYVEDVYAVFTRFVVDDHGCISKTELKALLQGAEIGTCEVDCNMLFQAAGLESGERIDFKQFVRMTKRIDGMGLLCERLSAGGSSGHSGKTTVMATGVASIRKSLFNGQRVRKSGTK